MAHSERIVAFVDAEFARETAFLAELVKVASDNPPGDCAPHAARAQALLQGLGLTVEAHEVPPGLGWRVDPYGAVIEDSPHGRVMFGRGVAVSKSDFATYAWTLLALKAAVAQGAPL